MSAHHPVFAGLIALFLGFALTMGAATPPDGVIARATRPDYVFVSWEPVAGAVSYQVFRQSDETGFSIIGTTETAYFHDTPVSPGTSYLYRVRTVDGSGVSGDSEARLATTVAWTDPTLVPASTWIKAAHFTDLGGAVNAARTLAGLDPESFAALTPGATAIQASHLMDLRSGLDAARDALSLNPLLYMDSIVAGVTTVRAQQVVELRDGVNGPRRAGAVCDPGTGSCDGMEATYCSLDGTEFLTESCDALQGMSCNGVTGRCEGACTTGSLATLEHPSLGCDFYPVVTANIVVSQFAFAAVVSNANADTVTITVTRGLDTIASTIVAGNSVAVINLPWISALKGPDNTAFPASVLQTEGAYRLRTTAPVTAVQFNPLAYTQVGQFSYTNDASKLMPAHKWGTKHRVASREHWDVMSGFYSVTAGANNTQVTLTSPAGAVIKAGGGLTSTGNGTLTLHAGDVLQVVTEDGANDLTGTIIESSKPVQVIGGHQCVWVPADTGYCDHLEESIPPIAALSNSYVVTAPRIPIPPTKLRRVRILATEDDTTLTYDPPQSGLPATLSAGQWVETANTIADFRITSSEPILVIEYMTGQLSDGYSGDPAMAIAVRTDQYQQSHVFFAPTNYETNYVNIVAPAGTTVTLDGVELPGTDFTAIGTSGYSVARKSLSNSGSGQHTIEASAPVGITVYGYGQYTSYWY